MKFDEFEHYGHHNHFNLKVYKQMRLVIVVFFALMRSLMMIVNPTR